MKTKQISLILAFLVFLSAAAFGQGRGNGTQERPRIRENLATLRLLRLTQALELNEEQAAKIFPTVNRIEKEKLKIQRDLSADIRDLRQLVRNEPQKEAEIAAKTKNIRDARQLIRQKDDELEAYLENNLNTVQRAKYLLFQIEFYRFLEQSLDRMRMPNNPPPAPAKKDK